MGGGTSSVLIIMSVVLVAVLAGCPMPEPSPEPEPMTEPDPMLPGTMAAPSLGVGNSQLRVNWTPPEDKGSSEITAYELRHSDDGGSNWSEDITTADAPATETIITNLTNGTPYVAQVRAVNAQGAGNWSESSMEATPIAAVPTEPNGFMLAVSMQTITASWTAPTDTGDSAIIRYELQHHEVGAGEWENPVSIAVNADPNHTYTHPIMELTNGTEYEVRVYAVNEEGNGNSATGTATPIGPPYAPNTPTLTAGNTELVVEWTAPNDGGSAITGYELEYKLNSGDWNTPADVTQRTTDADTTTDTITGLTNGTTYNVQVRAVNTQGESEWSASAALTLPTKPSAMNAPTLTGGNAQITATWTAPTDTGGSSITAYHVQHRTNAAGTWSTTDTDNIATITDGTATSHPITGLTNGTSYDVRVRAVNAQGTGDWSTSATGTTKISAAQATPSGTAATVSLSAASNAIITAQSPTVALITVEPGTLAVSASGDITVTAATAPDGVTVPTVDSGTGDVSVATGTTAGTYLVYGSKAGNILFAEYFYVTVSPADNTELDTAVTAGITTWGNTADLNYIVTTVVTDMSNVFISSAFNGDISGWDTGAATSMYRMFGGATVFNGDISGWDVSKVTNMFQMFYQASAFNGDISGWNVSAVTTMSDIFNEASAFNADISGWNVSKVTHMNQMFLSASNFNGNISGWDVSSVTSMSAMFNGASAFNQNISGWDVSKVTNMSTMFRGASAFNADISGWDVSKVTNMQSMFNSATAFNQDLEEWKDHWTLDAAGKYTGTKTNMFTDSGVTTPPSWY